METIRFLMPRQRLIKSFAFPRPRCRAGNFSYGSARRRVSLLGHHSFNFLNGFQTAARSRRLVR
jgi:hypothetical protein